MRVGVRGMGKGSMGKGVGDMGKGSMGMGVEDMGKGSMGMGVGDMGKGSMGMGVEDMGKESMGLGVGGIGVGSIVTFSSDSWTASLHSLIFHISIHFPLIMRRYIGLPLSYLLSLIPPYISDRPLPYRVALCLSPYPCGCLYPVRYISPQSSVTIRLDYVPSPQ